MMSKTFTVARTVLAISAAVGALAIPAVAFAQDAETADTSEDEIVVTAQGRTQLLSDVPVAISAVNAETLQNSGANDIRQLNQVAPSLLVSSTGTEANGSARIRGIGTVGDNPGLESSVPVFIDGVYRSRSGIGLNELGEIDRVEVQRGPQGTLGGRNSSAGLISIYSKKPSFTFGGSGELTYGNFDFMRAATSFTGPITEQLAFRVDGVYVKRDGFYTDDQNGRDVNNRDRYFLRGQLLFEPSDALSVRVIADYTYRKEECCAATYVDGTVNPFIGNLNNPATPFLQPGATPARTNDNGNNIINVLRDLGQPLAAFSQGYGRNISVSANRVFTGETKDYGLSGQIDYDFGGATLTSITAYRQYRSGQASDTDYSEVDILYRAPSDDAYRQFHTFTQELRLQGEAFGGKLDWLVGGFYANEKLTVRDNLRFGNQYGRFATCRIISGGGLSGLYSPTNPSCVLPGVGPATLAGATGASGADIVAAFTRLDSLNDRGTTNDRYFQNGTNWALFTHNIVHITDTLDLTLGLRYTSDKKRFNATFGNDNNVCTAVQGLVLDDLTTTTAGSASQIGTARALAGALIGLSCQGNSTAELNGVSIKDRRSEDEFTGTAILSWKPIDDLLLYTSFARGYKAGGFNLDRSALKSPILPFAAVGGAQALVGNLQFDPELVDSYELGAKYSTGPFSLSVSAFRSDFSNFQLNTFNGTVFLVQTVNGCSNLVGGPAADTDLSAATGTCATGDVTYGVRTQGVELEASLVPARNFRIAAGLTYASTKYEDDLVGTKRGTALDPALRKLPGDNLSNAPELVATSSITWTPEIGSSGLTGLFYIDGRMTSDYNTGSDLFPQKEQDGFAVFNARIGLRGPDESWGIELWGQNIFNQDYAQVAFNTPFQAGTTATPFLDPQFPGGRQIFSHFLAEPRTYGITLRGKF
ncbi:TonB-dependent receptor [Sphingorhabdus sp. IMCC26285]|uniref:TonB-dependent receptor n=1 Tax=Sphingorhabdus profundilacus TaxID=2509718 RepID=A0A6I4M5Y1_9SPHN|nr:TonB-dependent receptor [Sphingorhabdus profundilacus]MVZ97585.1 TonB-dependent receptor [Sphingorhabdus profundilacus]